MAKVSELKQKKVALIAEARGLTDAAISESRSLTSEDAAKVDAITKDIDALDVTIAAAEDVEKRTRSLADVEVATQSNDSGAEYRNVFENYVRNGKDSLTREELHLLQSEQRADSIMVSGTGNVGGYTVPVSFLPRIIEKLEQNSPIYALANRIETGSGEDLQIPKVTAHASASWIAENSGAFDSVNDTFAQVTMKSYVVAELAKLSVQLLSDSAVDLEGYLARNIGGSIGRAVGTKLSVGANNSTTTPQGLITSATANQLATGNATSFKMDDLIDLTHDVTPPYRNAPGTCFIMHDNTVGFVRKLKFSIGSDNVAYAWQPSNIAGQPDTLLGYAVYTDPNMDTIAASKTVVGFGNVNLAYTVRQAGGFSLRRLDERFADTFLVGFLGYMRIDGKLTDTNAFQTLETSAT